MVKLSATFFHDESSITIGTYESAIAPNFLPYNESIVYPFAQFIEKNEFFIENSKYFEIIHFVEHTGMASLSSL